MFLAIIFCVFIKLSSIVEACQYGSKIGVELTSTDLEYADVIIVARYLGGLVVHNTGRFTLLDVYKGAYMLRSYVRLPKNSQNVSFERSIDITGFDDPQRCLPSVLPNADQILLLRRNHHSVLLSANRTKKLKQTLLPATVDNVNRISNLTGWRHWNGWSSCSASCGDGGIKRRRRKCTESTFCDFGDTTHTAKCARYACKFYKDLKSRVTNASPGDIENSTDDYVVLLEKEKPRSISFITKLVKSNVTFVMSSTFTNASTHVSMAITNTLLVELTIIKNHIIVTVQNTTVTMNGTIAATTLSATTNEWFRLTISVDINYITVHLNCQVQVKRVSNILLPRQQSASTLIMDSNNTLLLREIGILTDVDPQETHTCLKSSHGRSEEKAFAKWTQWTSCNATCGHGVRYRIRPCTSKECRKKNRSGVELDQTLCVIGKCVVPNSPLTACSNRCQPPRGVCVHGSCQCRVGFTGNDCDRKICLKQCYNGGTCMEGGLSCSCPPGYTADDCSTPICEKTCKNGGKCKAPNQCGCPLGYAGNQCEKVLCLPRCRNGGKCIYPNYCECPFGTTGAYCENFECYPPCVNGGICIGPHECACLAAFGGSYCQRVRCYNGCLNNGSCSHDGQCKCKPGFYGPRCEAKRCIEKLRYKKVFKTVIRKRKENKLLPCIPPNEGRLCEFYKWRSVILFKEIRKPYFSC